MKKMPKGRTPSLIGFSNGRPSRVEVQRKSECSRCGCEILAGAECYNIPKKSAGFTRECRYCKDCYGKVLEQTTKELEALKGL